MASIATVCQQAKCTGKRPSVLGLKRIGEGLVESFSSICPECEGRGVIIDQALLG